jgi:hypothetical protein
MHTLRVAAAKVAFDSDSSGGIYHYHPERTGLLTGSTACALFFVHDHHPILISDADCINRTGQHAKWVRALVADPRLKGPFEWLSIHSKPGFFQVYGALVVKGAEDFACPASCTRIRIRDHRASGPKVGIHKFQFHNLLLVMLETLIFLSNATTSFT